MDIYEKCPIYKSSLVTLRQTTYYDADELLKCYSDEKAVPYFNSDNCHGDDFFYATLDRMKQAIELWNKSYRRKDFVRWTVILNTGNRIIGTIEMFHRCADDKFDDYGLLRIDLMSDYEQKDMIDEILKIAQLHFYKDFDVEKILTKAIPSAKNRRNALLANGWVSLGQKFITYDDYFVR